MTRDFTDEIVEKVIKAIKYDISGTKFGDGVVCGIASLVENCETDKDGLTASACYLDKLSEDIGAWQLEKKLRIIGIVNEAREMDREASINARAKQIGFSKSYLNILEGLVNLMDEGILSDSKAYEARVVSTPSGMANVIYNSLDLSSADGIEKLGILLGKNPDSLREWEKDALVMLLDSCVTYDEVSGNASIDYEKLSIIISAGYSKTKDATLGNNYITYETTDVFEIIAGEYDSYYYVRSLMYNNMRSPLTKYADLNAILKSVTTCYDNVKVINTIDPENPTDEYGGARLVDFGIDVFYDEEERLIRITTVQNDYEEINNNPFETRLYDEGANDIRIICASSENAGFIEAIRACDEDEIISMEDALWGEMSGNIKSKLKSSTVGELDKTIGDTLFSGVSGYGIYKKLKGYVDAVRDAREANNKIEAKINADTYALYCEKLNVSGNVIIYNGKVSGANLKIDETLNSIDINYYNLKEDRCLRVEGVNKLFYDFASSGVRNQVIEDYCDGLSNGNDSIYGRKIEFEDMVRDELEKLGYDRYNASSEEVDEAISNIVN